ncbi:hypothetical protein GCK72_020759 [Caenorhabditis remanei]|uniref:Uncharacterized protein n=1 Tax=Caenorhabditis remanei TaxID=31234 RepID=A0A6A5GIE7_CAERE|nr:hypothetical protein GCK72_020759 [Caenorhabditis remanei]KAF1754199.1 hypothetical protein GCK72_020759 [Caenorhabditis remanei]
MIDHWSNVPRIIWASTLGPLGFLLNVLMGYIIFKYTPDSMKTYSTLIMVMTISDAVNGFCSVMTSERVISTGSQLFVIFGGICESAFDEKLTKSRFCMSWYALQIVCAMLNSIIMIFSYVFRAYVITMPFDTINQKKTWGYFMSWSSLEDMDAEISKIYPELIGSNYTYSGVLDVNAPSQIVMNMMSIFLSVFVVMMALICKCIIEKYLNKFTFTENKKRQHRSLVNVLLYQTFSPFLSLVTVALYVTVGQTGGSTAILENLMPFSLVLLTVVSPIASCILIGPYRAAFFKLWNSNVSMIFGADSRLLKNQEPPFRSTISVTNTV